MTEVKITNLVKFYAVLLLLEKPRHGYELIKEIGQRMEKKVSAGQIYPFLSLLEKNKLIKFKATGERDKHVFSLTPKGKTFSQKMLSRFGSLIELSLQPRISVCAHCACKVLEGGHKEKIKGKETTFCCCHCAESFKKTHKH
ncbi:MAG: PadR family transcriptional regulator [archaeon]|nr:PadR family transcriptional regulator [archaeon]